MEACSGAHYWAREIGALGHDVQMIPPTYVAPFVKPGKTDAGDAEAISEAVTRKDHTVRADQDCRAAGGCDDVEDLLAAGPVSGRRRSTLYAVTSPSSVSLRAPASPRWTR